MATLTIRNLDEPLKARLRLRAAMRNRSMEEEARQILRTALLEPAPAAPDIGTRIRARFAGLGDVRLSVELREPVRLPPVPDTHAPAAAARSTKTKAPAKPR